MTKADIVDSIVKKHSRFKKQDTLEIVDLVLETIGESLENGEPVYLRGFGSFIIKQRAEKTARNITKGTTITIPAHKIPAFKPSKALVVKK